jgi:hypothetical protein
MNTEAGKIQGHLHTWDADGVQNHQAPWGNYAVDDPHGLVPTMGTPAYKDYMAKLIADHPDQMPTKLDQIPQPYVEEIEANPKLAGFTYQRQQR